MNQSALPRVEELEESAYNPTKYFHPDFDLALCGHVHESPLKESNNDTGEKATKLVELVTAIHGVRFVKISRIELRVFKKPTHSWDELSEPVREAFRQVYGPNIDFIKENQGILAIRRLAVKFKI